MSGDTLQSRQRAHAGGGEVLGGGWAGLDFPGGLEWVFRPVQPRA